MDKDRFGKHWSFPVLPRPLSLALGVSLACLGAVGCGGSSSSEDSADTAAAESAEKVNHLRVAKQKLLRQDYEPAADAVYRALVEDPNNVEATLVASQIELGRGNLDVAAEMAQTIDLGSPHTEEAIEVWSNALAKQGDYSGAADALLAGLEKMPEKTMWRHRAWDWLSRVGRREEASKQVDRLSWDQQATQNQMLSLVRRSLSFPFEPVDGQDATEDLESGLGLARWYYGIADYRKAMEELTPQYETQFESAAASALYGRLLAETQTFEEFPKWHAQCGDAERELSDYWAALGTYFYDLREYESSARALLEAVYRDPTDRVSFQRLSKVYRSLDRNDDGDQFRNRGVQISQCEVHCKAFLEDPTARPLRLGLAKSLAELGRPIEMMYWSRSLLNSSNQVEIGQLNQQLMQLKRDPRVATMASEVAMLGVDRQQYQLNKGMDQLGEAEEQLVKSQPTKADILANPRLVDVASSVGIDFQWYKDVEIDLESIPIHESLGGGISVVDYDLDGWPDIYLGQGSGDPPTDQCTRSNVLVRNLNGTFQEVTEAARVQDYNYTTGIAVGDINQDGFPDMWLGALGHNRLLINNGDGTFQEVTERLAPDDRFTSSLAIGDFNGDSLPDLFEANYVAMDGGFVVPEIGEDGRPVLPGPLSHLSGFDRWYENLGDGRFQEHEITMEIAKPGTSLGVVVTDFDADGKNEVFIGNDVRPNHLLVHTGDNVMANLADIKGVANGYTGVPNGCMGISAADYNRDGLVDIHITNFSAEAGNLYIQNSSGLFTDYAMRYGLAEPTTQMVGFGTKSIDFDRNGWLDLIITNGNIFDTRIYDSKNQFRMPPQLMMSVGGRFELADVEDDSGFWNGDYLGRAMSSLDFDRDGRIDVVIGHVDRPVVVLRNETQTEGAWIQLEMLGVDCEREAIGARVVVKAGPNSFSHWVTAGDGYLSNDEPVLDFGLGQYKGPVDVEVHWPGGDMQTFSSLEAGKRYLLTQGDEAPYERSLPGRQPAS